MTDLLIDAGCCVDGYIGSDLFRHKVHEGKLQLEGDRFKDKETEGAWLHESNWNHEIYTNLIIGNGQTNIAWGKALNLIGLRFLARHLVTLDFPRQKMYLKQTNSGPLDDENTQAAAEFLKNLAREGQLPGWSKQEDGITVLELHPNYKTYDFLKITDSTTCHYRVMRESKTSSWKLQKAWLTDRNNHTIEYFPISSK